MFLYVHFTPLIKSRIYFAQPCPKGSICKGYGAMPFPATDYWMDFNEPEFTSGVAMCCSGITGMDGQCIGSTNCNGGLELFDACFKSADHLSNCSGPASPTRLAALCKDGSTGLLCSQCVQGYFKTPSGVCDKCTGSSSGLIVWAAVMIVLCTILYVRGSCVIRGCCPGFMLDTGTFKVSLLLGAP